VLLNQCNIKLTKMCFMIKLTKMCFMLQVQPWRLWWQDVDRSRIHPS